MFALLHSGRVIQQRQHYQSPAWFTRVHIKINTGFLLKKMYCSISKHLLTSIRYYNIKKSGLLSDLWCNNRLDPAHNNKPRQQRCLSLSWNRSSTIIRHSRLPAGNALWFCQNIFYFIYFYFFVFLLPPPRFPDDNFWPPSRTAPEF